jgi:hypothetical protein
MDGTGSGSRPVAGFGISGVKRLGFASIVLAFQDKTTKL